MPQCYTYDNIFNNDQYCPTVLGFLFVSFFFTRFDLALIFSYFFYFFFFFGGGSCPGGNCPTDWGELSGGNCPGGIVLGGIFQGGIVRGGIVQGGVFLEPILTETHTQKMCFSKAESRFGREEQTSRNPLNTTAIYYK